MRRGSSCSSRNEQFNDRMKRPHPRRFCSHGLRLFSVRFGVKAATCSGVVGKWLLKPHLRVLTSLSGVARLTAGKLIKANKNNE